MKSVALNLPASKTKQLHIVPLSDQAFDLIGQLSICIHTANTSFWGGVVKPLFLTIPSTPLENACAMVVNRTAHGFRATARTMLDKNLGSV